MKNVSIASDTSAGKRMVKNTLVLYVRLVLTMFLTFFTTRELLLALGARDYGLSNVVGSISSMFIFISYLINAATMRFFSFELGRNDFERLKKVFSISFFEYSGAVVIIFILMETIGLWFFNNKLDVPIDRRDAAFYFFQFSIISFLLKIFTTQYEALTTAHEDMGIFALLKIIYTVLSLLIVYMLYLGNFDKLEFYGFLLAVVNFLYFIAYFVICFIRYPESRFSFVWDWKICKDLLSFSGWSFFEAISGLFSNVFVNVVLNNFFGGAANAARAISVQVSAGIAGFTSNFLIAANPQIVKYWAVNDRQKSIDLTFLSSRIGYLLIFIFACPILAETGFVLQLWLKDVPEFTVVCTQLIIISTILNSMTSPFTYLNNATGNIALYQFVVGVIQWMSFPVVYVFAYFGFGVYVVMGSLLLITIALFFSRLIILKKIAGISICRYITYTLLPCVFTTICMLPIVAYLKVVDMHSFIRLVVIFVLSCVVVCFFGVKNEERKMIFTIIKNKFLKR